MVSVLGKCEVAARSRSREDGQEEAATQARPAVSAAASAGQGQGFVRRLVAAGAALDVDGAGEKGDTPLIASCRAGQVVCSRVLIEAGANVQQRNCNGAGGTALYISCQDGYVDCVRLCLEAVGASTTGRGLDGVYC